MARVGKKNAKVGEDGLSAITRAYLEKIKVPKVKEVVVPVKKEAI